jgi:epsilon-lactone hydrolase
MPSPQSVQMRTFLMKQVKPSLQNATLEESRLLMDAEVIPTPRDTITDLVLIDELFAEWVRAPGSDPDKAVLYLHGGGYTCGSIKSHRGFAARLSKASGASVLIIEYRKAPEHPFPAALEDSLTAYRWLLAQGFNPANLAISGDSAGGGLALATLVGLRDAGEQLPAAGALLSPWTDLAASGASYTSRAEYDPMLSVSGILAQVKLYLGEQDPRQMVLASPLYAELHGLPPLLIHVGQDEILRDDSTQVAEKIKALGGEVTLKVWEGMWHVFQMQSAIVPEAQQAVNEIGDFLRDKLK